MKLKVIIIFLLIVSILSCKSQDRGEVKLMECFYEHLDDNGVRMRQNMLDFQQLLINEGILRDASGKSYRSIFESLATKNNSSFQSPSEFFISYGKEKNTPLIFTMKTCNMAVLENKNNDLKKIVELNNQVATLQKGGDLNTSQLSNAILEVLNEEDFELDYYKFKTFLLLDLLKSEQSFNKELPKSKLNSSNTFQLSIKKDNTILVDEVPTELGNLKTLLISYFKSQKSNSVVVLKTSKESKYKNYIEVYNEINSSLNAVRDIFSKKKFNRVYQSLADEEKEFVDKEYAIKIVNENI
ncbi:ExbD/TolR family protein [Mesonia aquimarina]|uniref:ExbD/TolR family protein n=1 Tax=Mesonia aquimarina TaxID=1504967 RepID=UPI0013CEB3CA|nr:biopolymer transporter ExbD [Mesonia aquimarina]